MMFKSLKNKPIRLYIVRVDAECSLVPTGLADKINKHVPNSTSFYCVCDYDPTQNRLWYDIGPNCIVDWRVELTKLSDERITKMRQDAWEMTADNLIQDNAATRRYVMAQLIAHSKSAQTDAVRIKALELMGKAIGLFTDRTDLDAKQSTPEQLKRELAGHLKLLERKRA
jgi:hypothetical protein